MPKGTRVDRCFTKLKKSKGESSAAAICQKSTGQSLATGKSTRKSDGKPIGSSKSKKSKSESLEARLHALLLGEAMPRVGCADTRLESKLDTVLSKHFNG